MTDFISFKTTFKGAGVPFECYDDDGGYVIILFDPRGNIRFRFGHNGEFLRYGVGDL